MYIGYHERMGNSWRYEDRKRGKFFIRKAMLEPSLDDACCSPGTQVGSHSGEFSDVFGGKSRTKDSREPLPNCVR